MPADKAPVSESLRNMVALSLKGSRSQQRDKIGATRLSAVEKVAN